MHLGDDEKRTLLRLAREHIESVLQKLPPPFPSSISAALQEPTGVFVTLRKEGDLRGCIGYVEARVPLIQAVSEVALKTAFEDPRFAPVGRQEMNDIEIEISVLSLLTEVKDFQEIEVGRHGLVIESGFARGLLLPHVATEHLWDREQFLTHTALKAGLPADSWKTGQARVFSFTTVTFSESEFLQPR
ncbi:MAG: AmmeMemoRadiSam system protein A [Ignavibacteriales bacterium]|nr:AmmeMemoRadiSam system protein A [Ignavibacteriales bacterium]